MSAITVLPGDAANTQGIAVTAEDIDNDDFGGGKIKAIGRLALG